MSLNILFFCKYCFYNFTLIKVWCLRLILDPSYESADDSVHVIDSYQPSDSSLRVRPDQIKTNIEMEFKEFEPRFKLSAGLNLETFDTILSGTNHI